MLEIAKKNRVNVLEAWLELGMKKKEIELFFTLCMAETELNDRSAFGKHCLRFLLEPDNLTATGMDEELLATFATESAHCGKATFLQLLLEAKADVNETTLQAAVMGKNANIDTVKLLLSAGARDGKNFPIATYALSKGLADVANLIKQASGSTTDFVPEIVHTHHTKK